MNIKLDKKLLDNLINKEYLNEDKSEIINDFVLNYNEIKEDYKSNNLEEIFKNEYGLDTNFVCLNENDYLNNYYVKNVLPKTFKDSKYNLSYKQFDINHPLLINEFDIKDYEEIFTLGYFKTLSKYRYLSIEKDNEIWMEITPHEINTMQKSIDEAFGNVVVYGLGLGYFPIMISLKDSVKKITIIENDDQIINIFNKCIKPFASSKITIVKDDALEHILDNDTNYCFIDLWHDCVDGINMYLALIKKERDGVKYNYWLEKSMLEIIRRYLICIICGDQIEDELFVKLNNLTKDISLTNKEELDKFLCDKSIKELIKKLP